MLKVYPSLLQGELSVPSSKSHTMRALLFGALGEGKSHVFNYLHSPDVSAMIKALRLLGVSIQQSQDEIVLIGLNGQLAACEDVIDCGNSGQILRFLGAISALSSFPMVFTGDDSIRHQRPITPLLKGLSQLGAQAFSLRHNEYAPIFIKGPLHGGHATICGKDSQPVSGLLMAAAMSEGFTELTVLEPRETPWINLTLSWFDRLGIRYMNQRFEKYKINGNQRYQGFDYAVPGDFSSAAFAIIAALITKSELTISNLDMTDVQGDKYLIDLLTSWGALFEYEEKNKRLIIKKSPLLQGAHVDVDQCIDCLPILAVLGCYLEEGLTLTNGSNARNKECDRIACITKELRKMGAEIHEHAEGLIISKSKLKGALVNSHSDHRIAMSLAIAGLGAKGETLIQDQQWIAKSYPKFVENFNSIGAAFSIC